VKIRRKKNAEVEEDGKENGNEIWFDPLLQEAEQNPGGASH
jgi:hypothetical protein